MYCIYCGTALPEYANFCSRCGKPVATAVKAPNCPEPDTQADAVFADTCQIVYVPVQEKKGLFPKEKGRFDAIYSDNGETKILESSPVFELGGFNIYGPEEKKKDHREQLQALVTVLKAKGWEQDKRQESQAPWYNLKFKKQNVQ